MIVGERWYVAQLLAGMRTTAEAGLKQQKFKFTSLVVDTAKGPAPLFPGYLFVFFDAELATSRWRSINGTRGIDKLLPRHMETPVPVRPGMIEGFVAAIAAGKFTQESAETAIVRYAAGDDVPIKSGPWAGHCGKLIRYRKGHMEVLLSLLGREIPVPVPTHQVEGS